MSGPIDRVDAALGHLLERLTVYHHRKGIPVRELVWAGAPRPLPRERPMHCHHEKTIEIDDRVAYVGGIDLTSSNWDRWDTPQHRSRGSVGWHDVATRITGPAGLYDIIKPLVGEARPPATLWLGHFDGAAFPSGHATQAVAFYVAGG